MVCLLHSVRDERMASDLRRRPHYMIARSYDREIISVWAVWQGRSRSAEKKAPGRSESRTRSSSVENTLFMEYAGVAECRTSPRAGPACRVGLVYRVRGVRHQAV